MKFLIVILLFGLTEQCQNNSESTGINEKQETVKQNKDIIKVSEYIADNKLEKYARATFAGGCFWCVEAAFERIEGVVDVISGYSGGEKEYPTYYEVGGGKLKHAEAVEIFYNPEIIDFNTLLEVFYVAHDGTQLNRQGPDVGSQYRSAIFYKDDSQKQLAETYIQKIESEKEIDIVTEIKAYDEFWVAEKYHQDYYELNPNQGYVRSVSRPKVEKVVKTFPQLIKKKYKKK